jgi:TATA-box binding protein (TBP) (component of TFIID and TFIIIB)
MAKPLTITPLRISTMTMTANWGLEINLNLLFQQLRKHLIPIGVYGAGILKFEHKGEVFGACYKDLFTNRKATDKSFFNQSTIVVRKRRDEGETAFKEVNVKLFANGGFQMTGVTDEEFSRDVISWMISRINTFETQITTTPLQLTKFNVQLLNSDYKMNAQAKRAELHKILCEVYNLSSTLETTIYQGVNTKYYYNETSPAGGGICRCPKFCSGQGDGTEVGACKRITIAVFQTGSIIITGARTRRQLDEAYDFMNRILRAHSKDVSRAFPTA